MTNDELIMQLSNDVRPIGRYARLGRIALGILAGGGVALAIVALGLRFRPDLDLAVHGGAFWMKSAYTIALGIGAVAMTTRLSRPEPMRLTRFWPVAIPFALLAVVAALELSRAPTRDWLELWLSRTWKVCPWLVLGLSVPIFAGLLWSFRRLAPTRLRAAGAAAGFSAGAWAAALYCLHCPEVSAIFVLTWYTLGIALAAGVGALVGPRLLRW